MPVTLRRSCAACVKAKHSCDLRTPQCSRCARRNVACVYVNAPLSSPTDDNAASAALVAVNKRNRPSDITSRPASSSSSSNAPSPGVVLLDFGLGAACDPFESYPQIRLPRNVVARLMDRFLSKIAFTYYPLDRNPRSNPFITSWWPRALADPALFHVSLQTASLDEELMANKGFPNSTVLMTDSVTLVRRKVQDPAQAIQDETMNAVVTMAAIEHGKGNTVVSHMHVQGLKSMVELRGGINAVMRANPLTARMVTWVALLVTGQPQFLTQDDLGTQHVDDGLAPIYEWTQLSHLDGLDTSCLTDFTGALLEPEIAETLCRLRCLFHQPLAATSSAGSELHDLTCFVLHRLLPGTSNSTLDGHTDTRVSICVRYGISIYMFLLHGHSFYPHAEILHSLVVGLQSAMETASELLGNTQTNALATWLLSTGMVAAAATPEWDWYAGQAVDVARAWGPCCWDDIFCRLQQVLWYPSAYYSTAYRTAWETALAAQGLPLASAEFPTVSSILRRTTEDRDGIGKETGRNKDS